jgi:hypothetical protein
MDPAIELIGIVLRHRIYDHGDFEVFYYSQNPCKSIPTIRSWVELSPGSPDLTYTQMRILFRFSYSCSYPPVYEVCPSVPSVLCFSPISRELFLGCCTKADPVSSNSSLLESLSSFLPNSPLPNPSCRGLRIPLSMIRGLKCKNSFRVPLPLSHNGIPYTSFASRAISRALDPRSGYQA